MPKNASNYNITKRTDGRWYTQLTHDGKKFYFYGKTQSEVRSKLKAKLFDIEQAKAAQLYNFSQAETITVKQWAEMCLKTYAKVSVRGSTYYCYLTIVNNYLKGIENCKLTEVSNLLIQEHLRNLGELLDLGEKSLLNVKNFLHWMFNQALINNMLMRNPVTGVKVPKTGKKDSRSLTTGEEQRLLTAAREYDKPIMFAVVFALYTGCRRGEILGLQWKDVDFKNLSIRIDKQLCRTFDMTETSDTRTMIALSAPKTPNAVRTIYMIPSFAKEFEEYKAKMIEWKKERHFPHSEEDFVFVGMKGKPIEPRVFYKYYREVMKNAGVEDANFHTLRHTFTTRSIENGADPSVLSKILGHAKPITTLGIYTHPLVEHERACMNRMEESYF